MEITFDHYLREYNSCPLPNNSFGNLSNTSTLVIRRQQLILTQVENVWFKQVWFKFQINYLQKTGSSKCHF